MNAIAAERIRRPSAALPAPARAPIRIPSKRHRWRRRLLTALVVAALTAPALLATAPMRRIDPVATTAATAGDSAAASAIVALTVDGGSTAPVPPGFSSVMGYTPAPETLADGTVRLVNPTGTCSVPAGGTRFRFDAACRAHDYGYDLLRYASATGQTVTGDGRKLLDGMFARDLRAHCGATRAGGSRVGCDAAAEVFAAGAGINSWRQGYGAPVKENLALWALGPSASVPAAALIGYARRRLRRRPGDEDRSPMGNWRGAASPPSDAPWRKANKQRRLNHVVEFIVVVGRRRDEVVTGGRISPFRSPRHRQTTHRHSHAVLRCLAKRVGVEGGLPTVVVSGLVGDAQQPHGSSSSQKRRSCRSTIFMVASKSSSAP